MGRDVTIARGDGYAQTVAAHPSGEYPVDVLDRRNDCKLHLIVIKLSHPVFFRWDGYNAGAWSPDGKQLIVSRVSDGVLMSLDIATLLKAKGVKP